MTDDERARFSALFDEHYAAVLGHPAVKREAERAGDMAGYVAAKEPWFDDAYREAWAWADASGWRAKEPG